MKDYLQTVTGPVAREDMGLTLPHEHLFPAATHRSSAEPLSWTRVNQLLSCDLF